MPTINKRFLLKLVFVILALVGCLVGVHTIQAARIPGALLRQADHAEAANKPDHAVRYLRQYLEFRPQDADAQQKLAQLIRSRYGANAGTELLFLYDKILRTDPARDAIRREAVMASLQLGRYSDAVTHAEQYLKSNPSEATVWRQLALAQSKLRRFEDAKQSYTTAIQHAPREPRGYQELAEFLWLDCERKTEAKVVYDQMVAALPKSAEAYLARARFLMATTDKQAAIPKAAGDPALVDLNFALQFEPGNAAASALKGERLQRHGDVLGARDAFLVGLKHHPDDESLVRSLAWLEVNRGNPHGAIQVLESAVERAKDGTEILVPLADLLLQTGDGARTREIIQKLDRRRGKNVPLRAEYLRGRLAMHEQRWPDAVATFTELRTRAVELPTLETQANLLLARCQQHLGETSAAIDAYRLVTTKEPSNVAARQALVYALLSLGKNAEALRELELAANNTTATPKLLGLKIQLQTLLNVAGGGRPDAALDRTAVQLANRLGATTADGVLLLADYTMTANRPSATVAILQKELTRFPNDARVWLKLAEATAASSGISQALKLLDEARTPIGDTAELRLAIATLYAHDPAKLRDIRNLESQTDTWPEEEQARLLYGLIDVADEINDGPLVLQLYKKIVARRPRDLAAWLALCERAWNIGDRTTAEEAALAISRWEPKAVDAESLCQSWKILATEGDHSHIVKLLGPKPSRANACLAVARSLVRQNRTTEATELFRRAVQLEPMQFDPARAYLSHLVSSGTDADLRRYLVQLGTDPRWSGDPFRRVVKSAAMNTQEPTKVDRMIVESRRFLDQQPGGLGWIADLYADMGRTKDALTLCDAAVRSATATTDDWLRYAIRSAEATGRDAGVAVVVSAKPKLTPLAYSQLAAAFVESRAGRGATIATETPLETRAQTESRLAILLAQLNRTEAIQHLDAYLAMKPDATNSAWAKRNLAMLLTIRGEPADRKRAYDLMLEKHTGTRDDQRATVAVLASLYQYMDGLERANVLARAVEILEQVTSEGKPQPSERFQLSRLYQAQGRTDDAVAIIQKLLNENPEKIEFLLAALGILNDANQWDAMTPFAERLLAVAPNDSRAIHAVAGWECRRGKLDTALKLLEVYERSVDVSAGEQAFRMARAAEWLQEFARLPGIARTPNGKRLTDLAAAKYETVLHARPDLLPGLAATLAADGRSAEAMEKIEKHATQPRWRALSGLAVLRVGTLTTKQTRTVEMWLTQAISREPLAVSLRLAQGEFYTTTSDFATAEKCYRQVLDTDPRNMTALNNLAWLLAPGSDSTKQATELLDRAAKETGLTGELLDTRARIRISAKQFDLAERDAQEALRHNKTPLRYFHLALAQRETAPAKSQQTYDLAKRAGLDEKLVHPRDVELVRNWR